jgi:asparagine synthase (glutamine-hydrolysing)
MCGIAGLISIELPRDDAQWLIAAMTDSLAHRGPNDSGIEQCFFEGGGPYIALGHRRLSIIDLSAAARQPMWSECGNFCVTFNGEIYNYIELREVLQRIGFNFRTESDTEVILQAYSAWGTDCFARFNGMWALAIVDRLRRKIILSRDRFGKKPIYYFSSGKEIVFASEIKALLIHPAVPKSPNYEKIFCYIAGNYRYVDVDDASYFNGIRQVPKSSFLELDETLKGTSRRYWSLIKSEPRTASDEEIIGAFRELLCDAVKIRLRSDVPVGCMLSGGMDSTSITCIAYKIFNKRIVTFSGITGEGKGVYDESEYIDSVIRDTNADSHYIKPDPADLLATIDEMISYHDEPICTVTWFSLFLIAKKIGLEKVPVVLNGHAGDELLAGYWDHYLYHFFELAESGDPALEHEIACWQENHGRDSAELVRTRAYISRLTRGEAAESARFTDYAYLFNREAVGKYRRNSRLENPFDTPLSRRLYSELMYETVPASLRPEDRNTMSQSIESRSPFLDYRLAEFAFSLPNRFKIRNGLGKWILREAMKGILPEDVRTRKDKAGFIAPADVWFRTTNRDQVHDLLNSNSFRSRGLFDIAQVNRMFQEHLQGAINHQMVLWQLVNLELWFRQFFDD